MQRVQRKFGTLLKRSEDEADVGLVLKEYEHADKFLTSLVSHGESWRNAWRAILNTQLCVAEGFHVLYEPIGADENVKHITAATPEGPLVKAARLETVYSELSTDLGGEIVSIDARLLRPAAEARDSLKALKKVIKQREDRKLDYERYYSRVETIRRKDTKSAKEETALIRHESDLDAATEQYHAADEQIKTAFPPLLDAVASLIPHLLATQIMLQHSLVANLYTATYEYCQQQGMTVPAPSLESVVSVWDSEFTPLRHEAESGLEILVSGKAVHQPMETPDKKQGTVTGLGLRNAFADRRKSSQGSGSHSRPSVSSFFNRGAKGEEEAAPPKAPRPSSGTASHTHAVEDEEAPPMKPPRPGQPSSPSKLPMNPGSRLTPSSQSPGSPHMARLGSSPAPSRASQGSDYFTRDGKPLASATTSSIAAKKKPPPPPPAKRVPSAQGQYVTALYDYAGQNSGDLSFREGERIRVIKKTDSTNDWWEGEASGVKGSFPANYVKV